MKGKESVNSSLNSIIIRIIIDIFLNYRKITSVCVYINYPATWEKRNKILRYFLSRYALIFPSERTQQDHIAYEGVIFPVYNINQLPRIKRPLRDNGFIVVKLSDIAHGGETSWTRVSFIFIYTLPGFPAKWAGQVSIEILNRPEKRIRLVYFNAFILLGEFSVESKKCLKPFCQ